MLLGIIEPDRGTRTLLGHERPLEAARIVGYLPEERGLYPAMTTKEAIAFMGALRGLPLDVGRKRAEILLRENGLGDYVDKPIKSLSKGMAQTIQLFGTIVHKPKLVVLDEPFSGLDAINQGRLESLIRDEAAVGHHHHLLDPCHPPCRAPVRADRDHRRRPDPLRGPGRRGARPAAAAGAAEDAQRRRAVARARCRPTRARGRRRLAVRAARRAESSRCSRR